MAMTDHSLVSFLKESLNLDDDLTVDSELFSSGLLDSMSMLNLIAFVEQATGIEVRPDDVTIENFDTPARIMRFAESVCAN